MTSGRTRTATQQLADRTVFVGGPFSAALKFDAAGEIAGFDEVLRAKFERVYAFLRSNGAGILSSHLAESFGSDVHETTLVQRDNAWLRACDLYLAVLPFAAADPYRSDGTFVEIGMAIGLRRPCLLLVEKPSDAAWSYYVRNLGHENLVTTLDYDAGEAAWLAAVTALITEAGNGGDSSDHIDDPHTLNSLVRGGVSGHTVRVGDQVLRVPGGALSPRYDASLRALAAQMSAENDAGSALIIGGGAGEVVVAALTSPKRKVTVFEPEERTREGLTENLNALGLSDRVTVIAEPKVAPRSAFDLVALHLPPLDPANAGPFATRRQLLLKAFGELLPLAASNAAIYIAVTSFDRSSDVFEVAKRSGLKLEHIPSSIQVSAGAPVGLWRGVRISN